MTIPSSFKKALLAGVLISVGALFSIAANPYGNVVQGLCFSVGLFGVLCCNASLFTGRVLAVQEIWRGNINVTDLIVLLVTVWVLNLIGAVCVAAMATIIHFDASYAAQFKAALPWHELLIRAVLCNVLVCLAVWTYRETWRSGWERNRNSSLVLDAVASCVLPVACFVACGFEHSVADMLYMPLGVMQGSVGLIDCVRVILLATIGNVIGGIAFSWLVYEGKEPE